MNRLHGQYKPTPMQSALGDPLRSELRSGELLPRVLSRLDLLAIFIIIVLFIPNASVVQATQGAGASTFLYWVIGTVTFLIPGAIITGQLNRFMPVDGSIYVWTHRALGPLWGFFAGFCAWFPGILVVLVGADTVLSLVQGIGVQLFGPTTSWLMQPWQQGIFVVAILLLAGFLSALPLRQIMRAAKVIVLLYAVCIFLVGLAGLVWLLSGHSPQPTLTTDHFNFGGQNIVLYGVIVLALLGVEVPLNMAGETREPHAARLFLHWGPLLVLAAYVIGTFGVMAVVPSSSASQTYSTLTAVNIVFGVPASVLVGLIFISFFLLVTVIYNITFARILVVSALDHRLPPTLAKVNRFSAPVYATHVQTILVLIVALLTFFLGPLLYPDQGIDLSTRVYDICQATATIIWSISMIILFLDLPVLLVRFHTFLATRRDQLVAPPWILYLCCAVGGAASLLGIWTTLSLSWDTATIPNSQWGLIIGGCTLISLVIGLAGSAYPRLLSSLDRQTAVARENARLYNELSQAYSRLSELDQLKDAFLTTASHELRTPLTIMQGYLELLGEIDNLNPEMRRSFINNARRACDELVLLQANIMDASRIALDTATLKCSSISLRETCISIVDLFEPMILQQKRSIEVNIDASLTVWTDETRLKQILRNLLANALRYSPPQTPIRLTAQVEHESDMVRVYVIDRGPGIPPDKREAIFDKFVRLERDLHGTIRGSGLGLFITRQLVEAMQGTITVESSGIYGEGSKFSFTIPLVRPAEVDPPASTQDITSTNHTHSIAEEVQP
jgi:signal transduction histidine kinase